MTEPAPWLDGAARHGAAARQPAPHRHRPFRRTSRQRFVSPWLARKDADWWIDRLYDFAADLDATIVHTAMSRTVIDVNRDPSGVSLYPGQATTELCPTTTFDGEPLYRDGGRRPTPPRSTRRQQLISIPITRRSRPRSRGSAADHRAVVLYDCHSIRSRIPRLFDGLLPVFNIGTNSGASCDRPRSGRRSSGSATPPATARVTNGRFKGGYITRHYGGRRRACMRSRWSSPAGAIWRSARGRYGERQLAAALRRGLCSTDPQLLLVIIEAALAFAQDG